MSGGEEVKTRELKATPEQQAKMQKDFQKRQAVELASYKKRLREGNELKQMQVEELELNIRYYNAKRKWFDLRPDVEKLDSDEQILMLDERAKREELEKVRAEAIKKAEEAEAVKTADKPEKKPEIIIPEVGKTEAK